MARIKYEESKYINPEEKKTLTAEEEQNAVDEIFNNADKQMDLDKESWNVVPAKQRKKKKIIRWLIGIFVFCIVAVIGITVFCGIYYSNAMITEMRQDVYDSYRETKQKVMQANDDSLETEYLKKIIALVTDEDVQKILDDLSFSKLQDIMKSSNDNEFNIVLVPEEKKAEYDKLIQEYNEKKAAQTQQENTAEMSP